MASDTVKILFIIDYFHRTGGTEKHLAQLIADFDELSPQPRDAIFAQAIFAI